MLLKRLCTIPFCTTVSKYLFPYPLCEQCMLAVLAAGQAGLQVFV